MSPLIYIFFLILSFICFFVRRFFFSEKNLFTSKLYDNIGLLLTFFHLFFSLIQWETLTSPFSHFVTRICCHHRHHHCRRPLFHYYYSQSFYLWLCRICRSLNLRCCGFFFIFAPAKSLTLDTQIFFYCTQSSSTSVRKCIKNIAPCFLLSFFLSKAYK